MSEPPTPSNQPAGEPDPANNPLFGLPMFGDLARALSGQGPLNWDAARQFATLGATGGVSESNVDPSARIALEALGSIVEMHARDLTSFDGRFPTLATVTPSVWAQQTLDAYRPLFTELATSLGRRGASTDGDAADDPMMAMFAGLSQMMAPSMMGMAVGSMVGKMAGRAFGQYDLPIPRGAAATGAAAGASASLLVVVGNVDHFASEWSLPLDQMRLWVLAQELIGHVLFSIGTVRDDITALVRRHAGGFRPDPSAIADHLASLGLDTDDAADPMAALQRAFADPAVLLGAVQSPEQAALAPQLDAAVAAVVGFVDYLVDSVAVRLIGGEALRIAEAVRRRRAESTAEDMFIERLLGLSLHPTHVQRGKTFIGGVVDRVGEQRLCEAFSRPNALPTPAELDAPGLWLARLDTQ
jgi:putative hydrolase